MAKKKTSTQKKKEKTHDSLLKELKILNNHLEKKNSRGRMFVNAIIAGLGTAIGLTIIAGLLITFLLEVFKSAESIPFLKDIADVIEASL